MLKRLAFSLIAFVLMLNTGAPALAQSGNSPLNAPVNAYLNATAQSGTQAYVARISANPSNAWNAGFNTFGSAPQQVGPVSTGFGQVNLPGIGAVTPTGSYTQDLVIPSGVPIFGSWNTGIRTTVNTYVDTQSNRIEAAVDPLSAFNYALTHSSYSAGQETGYANLGGFLGNWLAGSPASGSGDGAFRIDLGLAMALNSNYGQGLGELFGVGVYVYDAPQAPAGITASGQALPGEPNVPPIAPPPVPVPASSEEVYLKAVIPQPAPDFTLAFQPNYPVVIGQDPTQRGVDALGRASLGPCTAIWHHVLREQTIFCGKEKCNCSVDNCEIRENTREWDTTELEPDALATATMDSSLSTKSAAYITTELARIYPGSKIQQGQVRLFPSPWGKVIENSLGVPSTWAFLAERVPYADPGDWDLRIALTTTGTPHCAPLNWGKDFPAILTVWLREQRLVK